MNREKSYYHEMKHGVMDTERYCHNCLWYNHIHSETETGAYIINCASKECTGGHDNLNLLINGLIKEQKKLLRN